MTRLGGHGQHGGGGVRRPNGPPPGPRPHGQQPNPHYGGGQAAASLAQLWPKYLEGGYFDEAGHLKPEYVSRCLPGDDVLEESKQHGAEPLIRAMANARPALTTGQIRRFFGHCRALETKIKAGGSTWESVRGEFLKLDVAAADSFGKKPTPKIPELFHDFIRRNVAAVKTEKDFLHGFLPHFEALLGFGSIYIQKERN